MKTIIHLNIIFLCFGCNYALTKSEIDSQANQDTKTFQWNLHKEQIHNNNRNDSTKWSIRNWKVDSRDIENSGKPMIDAAFPVPKYALADSTFVGLGNSGDWKGYDMNDKKIIYHSFYVSKCNVNKEFIKEKDNEVFFSIAVLTDSIDLQRYSHTYVKVSSRNHPHYVGQGFVKTSTSTVDFISFLTADRNNYALVNMRLFDLRIGRIILISPKQDGTFRSLQLDADVMSSDEMDKHLKELFENDEEVIDFFTKHDNI